MKKEVILFLLSGLLLSCGSRNTNVEVDNSNCLTLDLDVRSDTMPSIAELLYLPLETTDSCLISSIDKILFVNNCFYIFDKQGKAVYTFDNQGRCINKIRAIGTGPAEYIEPFDMDVDEKGDIYVADNQRQRIIKYPQDGISPVEAIEIGDYFLDFIVADSNYIYLGDVSREGVMNIKLARFDRATRKVEVLEVDKRIDGNPIPFFSNHYFFRSYDHTLYFYKRFSPSIFRINGDRVDERIVLRSTKHPSDEMVDKWKVGGFKAMNEDSEYIRDICGCYETSNSIFITTHIFPLLYTVVDKRSGASYHSFSLRDRRCCGSMIPMASDGKYFVSYCLPTENTVKRILSNNPMMSEGQKRSISSLEEEHNPILILYRFDF